ncbi:MAG: hypothetical protein Fur005_41940 [Roseiflexaceae bacterium]
MGGNQLSANSGAGLVIMVIFLALGAINLMRGEWIDTGLWLALGVAIGCSVTATPAEWKARPSWQRVATIIFSSIAIGLVLLRIGLDLFN